MRVSDGSLARIEIIGNAFFFLRFFLFLPLPSQVAVVFVCLFFGESKKVLIFCHSSKNGVSAERLVRAVVTLSLPIAKQKVET